MATNPPNRIGVLRRAAGLQREDIAKAMDVTERTVYRWEKGQVQIPDEQKLALADFLGVPVALLMGWDTLGVQEDDDNGANGPRLRGVA